MEIDKIISKVNKEWDKEKIAKFIHIELGKLLVYDNAYTSNKRDKNDKNSDITIESKKRRNNLLNSKTLIKDNDQICKGMAEIYAAILDEFGIEAKVIGVQKKGDADGNIDKDGKIISVPEVYTSSIDENGDIVTGKNEQDNEENIKSEHYYAIVNIPGREPIIQDYLIEDSLTRIKIGEANFEDDNIPGFCKKSDYSLRTEKAIGIKKEFRNSLQTELKEAYGEKNSIEDKMKFIFGKIHNELLPFGFEESKSYMILLMNNIFEESELECLKRDSKFSNLIKEDEESADILCIYKINGKNYLIKSEIGGLENISSSGEITQEQIQEILKNGFSPRGKQDKENINSYIQQKDRKENVPLIANDFEIIAREIANENIVRNVHSTQYEIKEGIQERESQTKEVTSGAYINECGEIIRQQNSDSVGGDDGNR